MLSKIIVNSYKVFIEIALWASLLLFIIIGWNIGYSSGIIGAILGVVLWFFGAVIFFGSFLVLVDIREKVKSIEASKRE